MIFVEQLHQSATGIPDFSRDVSPGGYAAASRVSYKLFSLLFRTRQHCPVILAALKVELIPNWFVPRDRNFGTDGKQNLRPRRWPLPKRSRGGARASVKAAQAPLRQIAAAGHIPRLGKPRHSSDSGVKIPQWKP
jgi:hypothetical protein